jgi:serine/tyrosine/threonine adenylyltransferase
MQQISLDTSILGWHFENSYTQLPKSLYKNQKPIPVKKPQLIVFNNALAESLGLNNQILSQSNFAAFFSGNNLFPDSEPIAQAYAGHQFGHFTILGDGRAILLGEHIAPNGQRVDIQLKGSGQTPFSRRGDGRAALGPMLREYIISEAMHALGIATTRSLAVVTTGETIIRDTILPGAILTRVAASHIRVGTFEYAAILEQPDTLQALADYTIKRHYPDMAEAENPYLALLQSVMERQASLIAKWQLVGFIHGVMNTDNMALSGETIDYGPCAFMDTYDPATVFSSIDRQGRYAYVNQPPIAQWNLARLAESLLPLLDPDVKKATSLANAVLMEFPKIFQQYWLFGMRSKLGLQTADLTDLEFIEKFLNWMHQERKDYTNTFRALSSPTLHNDDLFAEIQHTDWFIQWQARLSQEHETRNGYIQIMRQHNPSIIPRNHKVEEALEKATVQQDFTILEQLLDVLKTPYQEVPEKFDSFKHLSLSQERYQTFCGT